MRVIDPTLVNDSLWSIDIGKTGGIVWFDFYKGVMMGRAIKDFGKNCNEWLACDTGPVVAEHVHIFGKQKGGETLIENRGILKGLCIAHSHELSLITPQEWQKCYTIKKRDNFKSDKEWKMHLIQIAFDLGFNVSNDFQWTSGTSDALLMWNYQASIIVNDKLTPLGELSFK